MYRLGMPSTIMAKGVNEAFVLGVKAIQAHGLPTSSRNGPVLKFPNLVVTCFQNPQERVLLYPQRRCNHFFHFFEALWMLAGRNDLAFVTKFLPSYIQFSDDGKIVRGSAYGHRWHKFFGKDQIEEAIFHLTNFPDSRRCVISHWDVKADGFVESKDVPCNTQIYFWLEQNHLCMTVLNRSNDMIWGAYGANAVHFSMLQEYIAMKLHVNMGCYNQVSNNLHVYTENEVWKRVQYIDPMPIDYYKEGMNPLLWYPMKSGAVGNSIYFDEDLEKLFQCYDENIELTWDTFKSDYFKALVFPLYTAWPLFKDGDLFEAERILSGYPLSDFKFACLQMVRYKQARKRNKEMAQPNPGHKDD